MAARLLVRRAVVVDRASSGSLGGDGGAEPEKTASLRLDDTGGLVYAGVNAAVGFIIPPVRWTMLRSGWRGDGGGVGEAEAWDEVFAVEAGGGPVIDDDFGEFCDGDFGFVVDCPAVVAIAVGEDGEDHGAGLAHNDGHVVADGVEATGFAGDGGAGFAGVDRLEIARDGLAVELILEHVEGYGTDGAVGCVGWCEDCCARGGGSSLLVEMAEADGFHEIGHLARGGLAEAELGLVGGHGAGRRKHDLFVEMSVGEAEGLDADVYGVDAEAVDGEVSGGVIADDDHHREDVFECEGYRGIEEGEEAGAGNGFVGVEGDGLVPAGAAGADFGHGVV